MTLVEQRCRLKQAGDSLKRQLHCVEARLDEQPHLLAEMRALYRSLERKRRPDFVVHWPHDTAAPISLVPFSALPAQRGATNDEYVFYEFLQAQPLRSPDGSPCSRWPGESVIGAAAVEPPHKKTRLPEPHADDPLQIRIVRWRDACTTGDFDGAAAASGPDAYFAEQRVSAQSHKLHAVTLPPVALLSLMDVEGGGSMQLGMLPGDDTSEPHRLILINCVLRLCAREHFRGLTLYLAEQTEPVALDYDTLALAGRLDLDLRQLGAPNSPCRLVTRSPLTLLFPVDQPHSGAVLRSAAPCHLALDGAATLQYVVQAGCTESGRALPPHGYCIETDAWLPIPHLAGAGTRMPRGGFAQTMERYDALQRMQVCFGTAGPPRFTLDDETLPVVLATGGGDCSGMLVWRGLTLARFSWDGARLVLRLVLPEDSQSVNPLKYHVY